MTRDLPIMVVDDDEDDRLLIEEAFEEVEAPVRLSFETDGAALLSRLRHLDRREPRPLVLLDLNMPRMSGTEVLQVLRNDPDLAITPVVIMSTSSRETDIKAAYAVGANTYVTKPTSFARLVELIRGLCAFWTEVAERPAPP